MQPKIVDASAVAALIFLEPEGAAVAARLGTSPLAAPSLIAFELANICLTKLRQRPDLETSTLARYGRRRSLRIEELDIDIEGCLDLARRLRLTAYDASYLWLARSISAELVTLDKKLARAAAAS